MGHNREPKDIYTNMLIVDSSAKAVQWRKVSLFHKRCWNSWTFMGRNEMDLCPDVTALAKMNESGN